MTMPTGDVMAEALRLTRRGELGAAAALLRGGPAAPAARPIYDLTPQSRTAPRPDAPPRPEVPRPAGDRFTAHRYRGPAGTLDYKLYLPDRPAAGLPLVVMLHGCTQSPNDFARGTGMNALADAHGFAVAWPAQSQSAHAQKCWNWFRPGDQRRDSGEPALIVAMVRALVAEHGLAAGQVAVAGLSAGGAAAAVLANAYPDVFAACGVHSGLACGSAHDLPSALQAMQRGGGGVAAARPVPTIIFHGDRDSTVAVANAAAVAAAAAGAQTLRPSTETGRSPGGRRWTRTLLRDRDGRVMIEDWRVAGLGHAWSGGDAGGSYADPSGPDASAAMVAFFAAAAPDSAGR